MARFKASLPSVEVCGCRFDCGFFVTFNKNEIEKLRAHIADPSGWHGVVVSELIPAEGPEQTEQEREEVKGVEAESAGDGAPPELPMGDEDLPDPPVQKGRRGGRA